MKEELTEFANGDMRHVREKRDQGKRQDSLLEKLEGESCH